MQFQVGQEVEWVPRGPTKVLRGKVIAVIPPRTDPVLHVGYKNVRGYRLNFSGKLRNMESYLVLTASTKGKKQLSLTWPTVSALRLAGTATVEERDDIEAVR